MAENRRVRMTLQLIKDSFLELLKTSPIGKITVADVCANADVNRGTFYVYYKDVYNLFEAIVMAFAESAITIVYEHKEECSAILGEFGDEKFLSKILELYKSNSFDYWKQSGIQCEPREYERIFQFITCGSMGIIRDWLVHGCVESPQIITEIVNNLVENGLNAYRIT
jgi:AcrR family transcriptional regulator